MPALPRSTPGGLPRRRKGPSQEVRQERAAGWGSALRYSSTLPSSEKALPYLLSKPPPPSKGARRPCGARQALLCRHLLPAAPWLCSRTPGRGTARGPAAAGRAAPADRSCTRHAAGEQTSGRCGRGSSHPAQSGAGRPHLSPTAGRNRSACRHLLMLHHHHGSSSAAGAGAPGAGPQALASGPGCAAPLSQDQLHEPHVSSRPCRIRSTSSSRPASAVGRVGQPRRVTAVSSNSGARAGTP